METYQIDVAMQNRLYEHAQKRLIDVEADAAIQEKRREIADKREKDSIKNKLLRDSVVCTVFRSENGDIMISHSINGKKNICSKLFDADEFRSVIYRSSVCNRVESCLSISWKLRGKKHAIFIPNYEIDDAAIIQKLRSNGIRVLVTNRKVAEHALCSFIIKDAEETEIPFRWGWNMMMDGRWHFCNNNKNMQEMMKYAD